MVTLFASMAALVRACAIAGGRMLQMLPPLRLAETASEGYDRRSSR